MSDSKMQISTNTGENLLIRVGLLFFLATTQVSALDNAFTQSIYNYTYLNPAYLGVEGSHTLKQHLRSQWSSLSSPIWTNTISYDHHFDSLNSGIGMIFGIDVQSAFRDYSGNLAYSYRVKLGEDHFLNFGITGGLVYHKWDLIFGSSSPDQFYDTILVRKTSKDFGAGIYYRYNSIFGGISVSHLYHSTWELVPGATVTNLALYSILVGYRIEMGEAADLIPTIRYFKQDRWGLLDVNTTVEIYDTFIAGFAYHENRVAFLLGLKLLDQLRLTYSYDYFFNSPGFGPTHEFGLRFNPKPKSSIY